MHNATKKWLITKISSGILIPFMIWFLINLTPFFGANHSQLLSFLSNLQTKLIFSLFLLFFFTFFSLTISEIFEDYIDNDKYKNAANKILFIFSIVFTLSISIFLIKI